MYVYVQKKCLNVFGRTIIPNMYLIYFCILLRYTFVPKTNKIGQVDRYL